MRISIIAFLLLASNAWAAETPPPVGLDHPFFEQLMNTQSWDCSRKTCTQIRSCAEACHKLLVCGHRRRDADNDGIPCENLCSRRC